jgi:hypothetical protein
MLIHKHLLDQQHEEVALCYIHSIGFFIHIFCYAYICIYIYIHIYIHTHIYICKYVIKDVFKKRQNEK